MCDGIKFICNKCNKEKIWTRGVYTFSKIKYHKCIECKPIKSEKQENKIYERVRDRAKQKGLEFNLNVTDIIIPEICPVLGIEIYTNKKVPCDNSPSVDRINPRLGYIKGNIRIISNRANTLKSNATIEEIELILKDLKEINLEFGEIKIAA